jgi:hypothetical protein
MLGDTPNSAEIKRAYEIFMEHGDKNRYPGVYESDIDQSELWIIEFLKNDGLIERNPRPSPRNDGTQYYRWTQAAPAIFLKRRMDYSDT